MMTVTDSNVIQQITEEKDLGVYVTADLKPSTQVVPVPVMAAVFFSYER